MRWLASAAPVLCLAVCVAGCASGGSVRPPVVHARVGPLAPAAVPAAIRLVQTIGALGSSPGSFREPSGIAVGPDGEVYVADTGNHRIQVIDPDGTPVSILGSFGWDPGEFDAPVAVALSHGARPMLYVGERGGRRVQVCDLTTEQYRVVLEESPDARLDPTALAVGRRNELYVTDAAGHRILSLSADGATDWSRGGFGSGPDRLIEPGGVAVSRQGRVLVSDTGNRRLVPMDFAGAVVAAWPNPGVDAPAGVAWSAGRWYVCDRATGRVVVLDEEGATLMSFGEGVLVDPTGVAVNGDALFVSDRGAHDIKRYLVVEPPIAD